MSLKQLLENRFNTFGQISSGLLNIFITLIFIEIFFSLTKNILGWTKFEVFFLAGVFRIISSLFQFLVVRGVNRLPTIIQKGELDGFLTRPVNSQLLLTIHFMRVYELIPALSGIVIIWYALQQGNFQTSIVGFLGLFLSLILGFLILYGIYFSVATLTIFTGRFQTLPELYQMIRQPLNFPTDILGQRAGLILTYVLPLAFVITIPVKIFFEKIPFYFLGIAAVFAVFSLGFSTWFWNFALKHYTSASS